MQCPLHFARTALIQSLLLPPDIKDWLSEQHFAHPASELVDATDLNMFYAPYEGDGRLQSPYESADDVEGFDATGVFSMLSRQCLSRPIPDQATLCSEVVIWQGHKTAK